MSVLRCTPVYASDNEAIPSSYDDPTIVISEPMTYEEMAEHFAQENGVEYSTAFRTLYPDLYKITSKRLSARRAAKTRELSVYLNVTSGYRPHIAFCCNTDESGNYWGITSIYYVTLVRNYNGSVFQYSGELQAWLRSPYQIEYVVNGDFYCYATQTVETSVSGGFGIGDMIYVEGQVGSSVSSNHLRYFYQHQTASFQS